MTGLLAPPSLPRNEVRPFPQLRYMGSKSRLLPWIHDTLKELRFDSALDAFSGSGCVAYMLKSMGKETVTNDSLNFPSIIARATIENSRKRVSAVSLARLIRPNGRRRHFIERTFDGIFFTKTDRIFLDSVWANLGEVSGRFERSLAIAALIRTAAKRQPRGVFTVAGSAARYDDGRRDLHAPIATLFAEALAAYNAVVFDNGRRNRALRGDVFAIPASDIDLVYMDPPYVPTADDNCYIKRYHFLEGLSCYWEGVEINQASRVKKIVKPFTPFGHRSTAEDAFKKMFRKFGDSTLVLSYSSNAFPELSQLVGWMREVKRRVDVLQREHRYHFGTHANARRRVAQEYLIVGT